MKLAGRATKAGFADDGDDEETDGESKVDTGWDRLFGPLKGPMASVWGEAPPAASRVVHHLRRAPASCWA